ncbi:MAG TPA: hypothetical protein VGW39_09085 [Chthoniobacterales bacterium]|nr:hypothetical protein [Chthoniobacterales bacterium]
MDKVGLSPDAIARSIVFAIKQPADVDVGEIIVHPTAQSDCGFQMRSSECEQGDLTTVN